MAPGLSLQTTLSRSIVGDDQGGRVAGNAATAQLTTCPPKRTMEHEHQRRVRARNQ